MNSCRIEVIDLRQDLEEHNEDKESVASENVPREEAESLIEADMQTTLIENKQALSEGGLSDHVRSDHEAKNDAISDDERLRNNGAAMLD